MTISKGWGAESAARAAGTARKTSDKVRRLKAIEARGGMTKGDHAAHEHYLKAWSKFTNLQERSNAGKKISPMRPRSFAPLEHQLPGYGGRTGSNWEFNGNKRVRKSMGSERRLAHQKKLSAVTSLVGGTAGLTGLALLAARRPKQAAAATTVGGGVSGAGAFNFASIQNQESKKRGPKQNVYVVRNKKQIKNIKSGLQPVTKALPPMKKPEAFSLAKLPTKSKWGSKLTRDQAIDIHDGHMAHMKRYVEPRNSVKKGFDMMDFGLSDVVQGENVISKAMPKSQQKAGDRGALAGQVATPVAGYLGAQAFKGGKMGYGLARSTQSGMPSSLATAGRVAGTAAKVGAKPGQMLGAAMKHPWATAGMMVGGAIAGEKAGHKLGAPKPPMGPKKPKQTLAKSFVPKFKLSNTSVRGVKLTTVRHGGASNKLFTLNPGTTHVVRGNGRSPSVINHGGGGSLTDAGRLVRNAAAGGTAAGLVYAGGKKAFKKETVKKGWSTDHPKVKMQAFAINNTDSKGRTQTYLPTEASTHYRGKSAVLRRPKYQVVGEPDKKLANTPGHKSLAGLTPNKRLKHQDAVTFANAYNTKAKNVTTSTGYKFKHSVGKAYNPEDKRLRRTDHQATALSVGAGAAATGAFLQGRKAVGTAHKVQVVTTKGKKGQPGKKYTKVIQRGSGLRSAPRDVAGFKSGLKSAGKAGGLGATAVGLAMASDRVRNYRHGRGNTYRALHR